MALLKRIWAIAWLGLVTGLMCAALVVAVAAVLKMHDAVVIRNGFAHDYRGLAIVMAAVASFLAAVAVASAIRLLRPRPAPPVSHF